MAITLDGTTGITTPASTVGGSAVLTTASTIAASAMPAGSVLQVVQFNYTGRTSIATGTYIALPILATITPSSASNKILVRIVVHVGAVGGNEGLHGRLVCNGSTVPIYGDAAGSRDQAWFHCGAHYTQDEVYPAVAEYLHSPASTSALTYEVWGRGHDVSYPISINSSEIDSNSSVCSRTVSTITLMEIAG
jgi:hypothetical protein